MGLNVVPGQPAYRMAKQCLKYRDHSRLKTDKADDLVDKHNVIRCESNLIKLVLGFVIDHIG